MSRIYQNNPLSIGNTPLVRLNRVVGPKATVQRPRLKAATPPIPSSAVLALP